MAAFQALNRIQQPSRLTADEVMAFASRLKGSLIHPGDTDYDDARRVWNGLIDRFPWTLAL